MSAAGLVRDRGGFVMAFVVFMLFAVSVAAATGYLVVSSEFAMAKHSSDGSAALGVARAGLERFAAEQLGVVDDTVVYALGNGVVTVTSRKLFAQDPVTDVYYLRAESEVADVFAPNTPARRVVGSYAVHRKRPLPHHGTMMISASTIRAQSGGNIHGTDYAAPGDCPGGGSVSITGAIAVTSTSVEAGSDIDGSPPAEYWSGGYAAMVDSIRVRWDVLSDPDFPIEFDGVWPNFGSLPADSFPVVRMTGWLSTTQVGRGVLIVNGTLDPLAGFWWDGIILAKDVDDYIQGDIRGLLAGGLDGPNAYTTIYAEGTFGYNSCHVHAANESLSYLELIDDTVFEAY